MKLAVEAAGPPQGRVDGVDAIGGSDDDHLPATVEAVHQCQERGDDGGVDLVLATGADRSQAVYLVEEDDGGTHLVGLGGRRGGEEAREGARVE